MLSAVGGTRQVAPWIDEKISTAGSTGEWSRDVFYERATRRAEFDGGEYVYTPFAPSEGKFVTVEMATTFPVCAGANARRWGESNSPQAPTRGVGANRKRFQKPSTRTEAT